MLLFDAFCMAILASFQASWEVHSPGRSQQRKQRWDISCVTTKFYDDLSDRADESSRLELWKVVWKILWDMLGLAEGTHTEVPKVLVINLDRSPQRWESAQVQFVVSFANNALIIIARVYI